MNRFTRNLMFVLLAVAIGAVFSLFISSIGLNRATVKKAYAPEQQKVALPAIVPEDKQEEKVQQLLSKMTLEEKVGQLFMIGFQEPELSEHARSMVADRHIGNIILFDRNMQNPDQVSKLNGSLQKLAIEANGLPLLIGIDQEGGSIVRMRDQVAPIPSQQELGKTSRNTVLKTAQKTASELKGMGFNVNFAPVLDLSDTDTRSFGTDPQKAYQYGSAVIEGFSKHGVTGALKHFPGNGRSSIDPHLETSSVQADTAELEKTDASPFKKMIETENQDDFFIMVTHIKYPAYDKKRPASISPVIVKDVLRKKFGYKGIVVTDDFEMGAVNKYYTYEELGFQAINAGADLLLVCHQYDHQLAMYKGVLKAAKDGRISKERIDEAAGRIVAHKLKQQEEENRKPE